MVPIVGTLIGALWALAGLVITAVWYDHTDREVCMDVTILGTVIIAAATAIIHFNWPH